MRALWTAGLGCILACGGPGPEDWPDERPLIEEAVFLQSSPFVSDALAFALRWRDGDGNLSGGETVLFIAGQRVSSQSNVELFAEQQPPLPPDAESGWLEFLVRLDERPSPGQRLAFSFELVDSAGEVSNRPTVTLRVLGGGS
ncbi:MAG: hypothetical protein AAF627_13455 [Myxococcota bacterium]